ncbi:MAG: bifunctional [glutamine synthetase] adenylyltransferase/[glutamine synthetase]-adenylyl-L-tyrosine phosphorylase, partial [Acidimicrobiales bacterium]
MPPLALPRKLASLVEHSAAPESVRPAMATLAEMRPQTLEILEADSPLARSVVGVMEASRSLSRLLVADSAAIEVIARPGNRVAPDCSGPETLARWKRLELLRIASRDLSGTDSLEETGTALATLGDDVLAGACTLGEAEDRLAVIGMGKLGGQELNYASDIDVLFVGSGDQEERARRIMATARMSFRVDANLRPEGRSGSLVRSLDSYRTYWARWAMAWERQALLKARPVAGAAQLGEEFAGAASEQVWGRPFGAEELHQVRGMKVRAEGEVARRGLTMAELKRGYGGIRDVEFSVQLLQLVHGRLDPALRPRSTLSALAELGSAGYVDPSDAKDLE